MDNRPIKINKSGKYNLNFIDWDNEYQNIIDSGHNMDPYDNNQISPIPGMSIDQFNNILRGELQVMEYVEEQEQKEQYGLKESQLQKITKMRVGKTDKECAICTIQFKGPSKNLKGDIIRKMPCGHIFHDACIIPWLQKNSTCPNCRFDIKQYLQKNN